MSAASVGNLGRSGDIIIQGKGCKTYLMGEGQGVPGGSEKDRNASGQKRLRQALTGLAVAGHYEAEHAPRHRLQHRPMRLHLQLVYIKLVLRALYLYTKDSYSKHFLLSHVLRVCHSASDLTCHVDTSQ